MRYTAGMAEVQSVGRAFSLLRSLSLGDIGVTELSDRTGLPKSTVSRLLATLESERAVHQNDDGTYGLGDGLAELGQASLERRDVVAIATPHMTELMERIGEAVGINRLEGFAVRTLAQVDDPSSSVVVRNWTDAITPAHAVPAGICMLAYAPRSTQRAFLAQNFEALTAETATSIAELEKRFEQARADGFAWGMRELTTDINSVAAPIVDRSGRTTLALHLHGPSFRFPASGDIEEIGERLVACAQRIEAQLAAD